MASATGFVKINVIDFGGIVAFLGNNADKISTFTPYQKRALSLNTTAAPPGRNISAKGVSPWNEMINSS